MQVFYKIFFAFLFLLLPFLARSQSIGEIVGGGEIRGNFQIEAQYYQEDSIIGAEEVPEDIRSNAFLNLIYTKGPFSAGIRYESYLNPLLGYPTEYEGNGIMYRFASYTKNKLSVSVGNFYEQFGQGLILRTYEERGLGYDNALDGIRVKFEPVKGMHLTGLIGKQRHYFEYGEGIVRGFDAQFNINDLFSSFADSKTRLLLGGSVVSKYQEDNNIQFNLPENVGAVSGRFNLSHGGFIVNGEYAYKINDPSYDNEYIYKPGEAIAFQTTYSQRGLGLSFAAQHIDNMSFRSERDEAIQDLQINYIPSLTKQHTYNLLATLYPYATQPNGEVAFQGDAIYNFEKGSVLGGKYGTNIQLNYSTIKGLDKKPIEDAEGKRLGYSSDYFDGDETYFKDFNVTITKKFSSKVRGIFTYSNLVYNKDVILGKVGEETVYADVAIADITYKFDMRNSLRMEAQHLSTDQDQGDWATLLFEYSYSPHWYVAILDQYNYGNAEEGQQIHYYNISAGYINKGNRYSISYGRQKEGLFCVGGVCRVVPASNGLYLSITSSF